MTLRVLVRMLQPLSYLRLYGEQGWNLIITTPVIADCIGNLLKIGRPPAYKTKTVSLEKILSSRWELNSLTSEF